MARTHIEDQAEFYANIPILDPQYRSCVHLENEADERFWDTLLQHHRPGVYYYIYYSKNNDGIETRGCDQCMKYKGLLSDRFFVCIDSDLRFLRQEANIHPRNYILQTYTYSWENHYCFADQLQKKWSEKCPEVAEKFDFNLFLRNLSNAIYEPLLLFLSMDRKKQQGFPQNAFNQCLPKQCKRSEISNHGENLTNIVQRNFTRFDPLKQDNEFDFVSEQEYYCRLGLTSDNAYLHVKGHHLYHLIMDIGKQLCRGTNIKFERDILLDTISLDGYWEVKKIGEDLKQF